MNHPTHLPPANIHEAARRVLHSDSPELPYLDNCGLCHLFNKMGAWDAYEDMPMFSSGIFLPEYGTWTEQRLLIVCLLAETNPEDFV